MGTFAYSSTTLIPARTPPPGTAWLVESGRVPRRRVLVRSIGTHIIVDPDSRQPSDRPAALTEVIRRDR